MDVEAKANEIINLLTDRYYDVVKIKELSKNGEFWFDIYYSKPTFKEKIFGRKDEPIANFVVREVNEKDFNGIVAYFYRQGNKMAQDDFYKFCGNISSFVDIIVHATAKPVVVSPNDYYWRVYENGEYEAFRMKETVYKQKKVE